jgi:hypothetical protein
VEDVIRLGLGQGAPQVRQIAHVSLDVSRRLADTRHLEQGRLRVRRERKTGDRRSQFAQPERQPAALEPRMPGEEDPLASVGLAQFGYHFFHGA